MNAEFRKAALSYGQRRLWLADQVEPGSLAYSTPFVLRLRGRVRPEVVGACLSEIVRRHEVLRTTFAVEGGVPVQVVGVPFEVDVPVVDCRGGGVGAVDAAVRGELSVPFDLARGPLLRARLIVAGVDEWVLVLNMHHIVVDGWSVGVLQDELLALYPVLCRGDDVSLSGLAELPLQYADFAGWQLGELTAERRGVLESFWCERLAGAPAYMRLPYDRLPSVAGGWEGDVFGFGLDAGVVAGVRAFARAEGCTPFMVLLAAYKVLLWRLTGETDVVVATPVAGRGHASLEGLIGFFVNNVVLRTDLGGGVGFREVVRRVRETVLDAQDHQDLPFDLLVAATRPPRLPGRTPYLQTSLVHQPEPVTEYRLGDLVATPTQAPLTGAPLDLTLSVFEGSGIDIQVNYRSDLFDADTIKSISEQFVEVLRRGIEDDTAVQAGAGRDGGPASTLTGPDQPAFLNLSVTEALARVVRRAPQAVAVQSEGVALSYAALDAAAEEVSAALRAAGVGPGDVVGLALEPGVAMVVTLVAVVRTGAAYMCLDTTAPAERNTWLLQDAGCCVLVSHAGTGTPHSWTDLRCARLAAAQGPWRGGTELPEAERPAYVVHTSGSTGQPKGVVVVQEAVCNWSLGMGEAMGVDATTNIAQLASPSFDVMSAEVWMALLNGARLSVVPRHERRGASVTVEALRREGVTLYMGTPGPLTVIDPADVPLIDTLVLGGDALSDSLLKTWLPQAAVGQVYGASEGTMSTTVGILDAGSPANRTGRPLPNTSIHLLTDSLEPVPAGEVGEIFIGGVGVGQEYLGRPALTAEKFLPDPFGRGPGARLYRTGDLGRITPDGQLEFVGRLDDMLKIRGVRVEPAEVEAAIGALAGVSACAVAAEKNALGDTLLRAYVIPADGAVDETTLRSLARTVLPDSMIPHSFVCLDSFPLTTNGKIDRAALLKTVPAHTQGAGRDVVSEVTRIVLDTWEEVLGQGPVTPSGNFFELGGDSMGVTRVIARLERSFGVRIEFSAFLRNPTVRQLVRHIEDLRGVPAASGPTRREPGRTRVALSYGQRRLWLADQVEPGSLAYSTPFVLRLRGRVRPEVVGACLSEIVRRHEVLRTTFAVEGGVPVQVVGVPFEVDVPVVDCRGGGVGAVDAAVRGELSVPFDLARGPLLRARLIVAGVDEWVLVLNMHHIVVDGWSVGVLQDELLALYPVLCRGDDVSLSGLAELPLQYADFAGWQVGELTAERRGVLESFWCERLAGAPAYMRLPYDRLPSVAGGWEGDVFGFGLDAGVVAGVRAFARAEGCTPFMVLLAAYKVLLWRLTGETDVVVATPVAGRGHASLEGLIGFFVNNVVLRTDLGGGVGFREVVRRVRETVLDAQDHQDLPFDLLVAATRPRRRPGRTPYTEAWFGFEQEQPGERMMGDVAVSTAPFTGERDSVRHDFTLDVIVRGDVMEATLSCRDGMYSRAEMREMADLWREILTAGIGIGHPDRK
ncbi:amino acid adenylation domain-containing protein [Streptomyces sp. FXJ1.172]|uniref:amino acid adenylation domain-containing protein n=1 Tax=Streptomyces sp. FXJ1.172 TaxID=710705 RepID=UPI0023DD4229|nr:amino acid adenylation domain-containing protein [Streptomyces sp. FXJ1.172]WEO95428.1 amino acid adenylation domain-containing protein [Streptomyces sp. FXJ1.172]